MTILEEVIKQTEEKIAVIATFQTKTHYDYYSYVLEFLKKQLPVDPTIRPGPFTDFCCGRCGWWVDLKHWSFCPYCGAEIGKVKL